MTRTAQPVPVAEVAKRLGIKQRRLKQIITYGKYPVSDDGKLSRSSATRIIANLRRQAREASIVQAAVRAIKTLRENAEKEGITSYTVREAQAIIGVEASHLRKMVKSGLLRSKMVGIQHTIDYRWLIWLLRHVPVRGRPGHRQHQERVAYVASHILPDDQDIS